MSLSDALSIAITGLKTSSDMISLTSNNISNAQTPGYTTKTANVTSVNYGSSPGGSVMSGYSGTYNQALTNNFNSATSESSYYGTQNSYMTQIQSILGSSSTNPSLSQDIAQFASAWSQYSAQPESPIEQQNVINTGATLVNDIGSISTQVNALSTQIQGDITNTVKNLNSALSNVATLNQEMQTAATSGQPTANIQDQLNTAITTVSGFTNVVVQPRANGQVALYTTSGQPLVDSAFASQFSYNGTTVTDQNGNDVTNNLIGGSLQAQLGFVSTSTTSANSTTPGVGVIAKLQAQLSTYVNSLTASSTGSTSAFATAYSAAATASTASTGTQYGDPVASSFFTVSNGTNGMPDPNTLQVNANLLNGTDSLPQMNTQAIANSFNSTANYSTSGLSLNSVTYNELAAGVVTNFQQIASSVNAQNTTSTSLTSYYQTQISNTTGVNLDQELSNLTVIQNSYAASAHVISTINTLMTDLLSVIS